MLTFAHPSFLWFMLVMAVPLCLHLLNFRQARRVVFPSIQFLVRSRQPQHGRRRLRDILVLLLRVLAVGAGALLLAGPGWQSRPAASGDEEKTAVFVVDVSSSMAWGKRMERALECIRRKQRGLSGWRIGLVPTVDGEASVGGCVAVPPTLEAWRLDEALGGYHATYCSGDAARAVKAAVGELSGTRKKVIVVSDFQATEWSRRCQAVPADVDLELLDVADAVERGNAGISDVACQRLGARRLRVIVTVVCTGDSEMPCTLTLQVGEILRREALTVPAHGRVRHAVVFDDVEVGQACRAQLSADSYPHDDVYVFWGDGAPPMPVVLAVNSDMDSVGAQEAHYVQTALESGADGSGRFSVVVSDVSLLEKEMLERAQAVFLLGGCGGLQNDGISGLRELLGRGGVLFATPGKNAGSDLRCLRELGLDFGRFQGVSGMTAHSRSDGVGSVWKDSVLAPLYGKVDECDLYSFAIRRCVRVIPSAGSAVHLRSLAEVPLLLERPCGRGRGYYMSFGFDGWWGDFQLTNSFLPMLHELLMNAVPRDFGRRKMTCGAKLMDADLEVQLEAAEPQLHRNGREYVEINVEKAESVEAAVGKLDVRDLLKMPENSKADEAQGQGDSGIALERWLGWLLLVAFIIEMALAMTRRPAGAAQP